MGLATGLEYHKYGFQIGCTAMMGLQLISINIEEVESTVKGLRTAQFAIST
jgi:hypothetical protein